MKKYFKNLSFLVLASMMVVITSCGDDDPIIDPGVDGINVADGLYLQADGADPVSSAGLSSEVVEANDFQSQDRDGFNAGFMYLTAGNYNVVQVTNKEVTATIGGSAQTITDEGSDCDFNDFTLVTTEADGAAFAVPADGLYKVTHDATTNELIMYNISQASIIGSATEGGWSADTDLAGTVNSDGASWTASNVILRSGEWKVRFNCRWGINRRVDPTGSLNDPANGYQLFTNFGGSTTGLITGGNNIAQDEDGEYTVTIDWTPQNGFALTATRTGDAPVLTFNPNDFQMAVIGSATANTWDADRNLFHKEDNGVHTWYGVVTFAADGEYKFRANDEWNFDLGGNLSDLSIGGGNVPSPGAGAWYIALTTTDEGDTWSAMVTNEGWGIIGDATPNSWDSDTDMEAQGFDADGNSTYTLNVDLVDGQMKFRAADDWAHNLGGDVTFLTTDGDNINVTAGNYDITLSYNGEVYSATIQ